MKSTICAFVALMLLGYLSSCSKNSSSNSAKTVANISGTYGLNALSYTYAGLTVNYYDSLPACEKDNLIKLNADLTANFIDAGIVCTPPLDSNGVWSLAGDSIYLGGNGALIKSFDGKTMVLTQQKSVNGFQVTANSTLVKH